MTGIEVRGVSKSYPLVDGGEREALRGIDLTVAPGEFVCLLGPSGCGKTTLLNIMSGLDPDHAGSVRYVGERATDPVMSYMFQDSRLLPWMTIEQNVLFVLDKHGSRERARARDWLQRVGLGDRYGDHPYQLSIGMQQRTSVARALIVDPDVLYMDEPFSALDELTAQRVRQELLDLWSEQHCSVVFVTHNSLEAAFLADRIVLMTPGPGRILEEIDLRERLSRPRRPDDDRLWQVSREAVAKLTAGGADPASSGSAPVDRDAGVGQTDRNGEGHREGHGEGHRKDVEPSPSGRA